MKTKDEKLKKNNPCFPFVCKALKTKEQGNALK